MTLALSMRFNDGFALAADSAMTFRLMTGDSRVEVSNVFNTVEKLFDLRQGSPLGLLMCGVGNIGDPGEHQPAQVGHVAPGTTRC
jgi:hypothetical protein